MIDDSFYALRNSKLRSIEEYLWVNRSFIRIIDSSKILKNSISCFSIKSFNISRFANFKRSSNMNFNESTILWDMFTSKFTRFKIWSYRSNNSNPSRLCNLWSDPRNSSNISDSKSTGSQNAQEKPISTPPKNWEELTPTSKPKNMESLDIPLNEEKAQEYENQFPG